MSELKIILTATEPSLAKAWREFCGDLDGVTVHDGSILELECDAVVSPANSFGFMDGGIDALYRRHFGVEIQDRVRRRIGDQHGGELLVGQADIVETGDEKIPYLVVAPTMRVPMTLRDSVNPYLAARAVLRLVSKGLFEHGVKRGIPVAEKVRTVAFPGLGTGVGQVGPATCAHQVRRAIEDTLLNTVEMPRTWAEASERHQLLYTDMPKRLQ